MSEQTKRRQLGGRPTKYDPAYCDALVAFMGRGYSMTAFAGEIGVCRDTITEWKATHPAFSLAIKRGQAARTRCLETTLLLGETGPRVTAHIFALKNACPEEWRDKHEQVLSGPDGGPIESEMTIRFVRPVPCADGGDAA